MQDERIGDGLYSPTGDTNESSAASDVCALSSVQSTTDEASVTSGFYTIHSGLRSESSDVYTEGTGTEEDQEPIYSVCKGDDDGISLNQRIEDIRSRSNSILSAGSFRGDGSDPSSVRPLLSADELSDLIVGRYPPRKTISNSMDSDCDYVTMPLPLSSPPPPPPPPPRTDSERQMLLPPPPPYPVNIEPYATINVPKRSNVQLELDREREPPPPPPYNATRGNDFVVPLPPRRTDVPPPPPPYTSPRERIQMPPPTPPRNDAVMPREPPPPPPPYPNVVSATSVGSAIPRIAKTTSADIATSVAPKPPPRIQPPTYPGDKMKPTPVHAPVAALVVSPNNYLDVHASRSVPVLLPYLTSSPPPPPPPPLPPMVHSRQPPPPPPPPPSSSSQPTPSLSSASSLATVYTSQVAKSQIEQYEQQLRSNVDYVMFPLKDPAVSKQEYIDAKQGSLLAAMAAYPPPPYPSFSKSSVMYRSTPYLPGASFSSSPSKFASNQNLSDTSSTSNYLLHGNLSSHYAASTSSLYSGATCSSIGSHSLRREPPAPVHPHTLHAFSRTRSDENILKCLDSPVANKMQQSLTQPKHRRLPPPPPPPLYEIQVTENFRNV